MTMFLFLALIMGSNPDFTTQFDNVEQIEHNVYVNYLPGQNRFDVIFHQYIYYQRGTRGEMDVRGWTLSTKAQDPVFNWNTHKYEQFVKINANSHIRYCKVQANQLRKTVLPYDPELFERDILKREDRTGMFFFPGVSLKKFAEKMGN